MRARHDATPFPAVTSCPPRDWLDRSRRGLPEEGPPCSRSALGARRRGGRPKVSTAGGASVARGRPTRPGEIALRVAELGRRPGSAITPGTGQPSRPLPRPFGTPPAALRLRRVHHRHPEAGASPCRPRPDPRPTPPAFTTAVPHERSRELLCQELVGVEMLLDAGKRTAAASALRGLLNRTSPELAAEITERAALQELARAMAWVEPRREDVRFVPASRVTARRGPRRPADPRRGRGRRRGRRLPHRAVAGPGRAVGLGRAGLGRHRLRPGRADRPARRPLPGLQTRAHPRRPGPPRRAVHRLPGLRAHPRVGHPALLRCRRRRPRRGGSCCAGPGRRPIARPTRRSSPPGPQPTSPRRRATPPPDRPASAGPPSPADPVDPLAHLMGRTDSEVGAHDRRMEGVRAGRDERGPPT